MSVWWRALNPAPITVYPARRAAARRIRSAVVMVAAPLCGAINFADRVMRRVNVGEQFGDLELIGVVFDDGGAGNVRRAGGGADVLDAAGPAVCGFVGVLLHGAGSCVLGCRRCCLLDIFGSFAVLAKPFATSIF